MWLSLEKGENEQKRKQEKRKIKERNKQTTTKQIKSAITYSSSCLNHK